MSKRDHEPLFPIKLDHSNKKQLFIDATITSLAEHGFGGTTVRKIAQIANVSPGLLTHYYSGKEVLVAESYKYLSQRFLENFKQRVSENPDDPIQGLRTYFSATYSSDNLDPKLLRVWLSFWSLTLTQADLQYIHHEANEQYLASIEQMLTLAFAKQEKKVSASKLRQLAIGINALLDGLWIEWCLDQNSFSAEQSLEIVYTFVENATGLEIAPR